MFYGIEKAYANAMIEALRSAQQTLFDTLVADAISSSHVLHKGDTLGLDARPENTIVSSLQEFDPHCIIIAEERGAVNPFATDDQASTLGLRTFFGCDPYDRSNQGRDFLKKYGKSGDRIIDVVRRSGVQRNWTRLYGGPISITSSTSAIACVRRGLPIASVILNHLAETMTLACAAGIFHAKLPTDLTAPVTLDYIQEYGTRLTFPQSTHDDGRRIVTFMGKPERGYPANFDNCKLLVNANPNDYLHYTLPGGPSRVLYLSNLQPAEQPIGVVVANGEKLGEWIHWLAFTRFAHCTKDDSAPALRLFEVSQSQCAMIDGYMMMPSEDYSAFVTTRQNKVIISSDRLQALRNPSKYRATLILIPAGNNWALSQVQQFGYRELAF